MLKQIPEEKFFEMLEAFFTGELSYGYGGKIMAKEPEKIGRAMLKKKFLFKKVEQQKLQEKNLVIFNDIANGFNQISKPTEPVKEMDSELSELTAKCHTQLRRYLKFFVQNQILFSKNTLSFEKTFAIFKKLLSDLENENSGLIRITQKDLKESFKKHYSELSEIEYQIPFWEMVATLWVSLITEIYHERKFDPQNHQVVLSFTDLNELSINGIRQTFFLPEINETQRKVQTPDQRNIWYEDGVLHFKDRSGGEKIIDMSTAYTQKKLFDTMWSLWTKGTNNKYYLSKEQIFSTYKKINNLKSNSAVEEEIGSTKLGKIVANIRMKFMDKSLDKQLTWNYKKKSNDESGYIFDLKPLV